MKTEEKGVEEKSETRSKNTWTNFQSKVFFSLKNMIRLRVINISMTQFNVIARTMISKYTNFAIIEKPKWEIKKNRKMVTTRNRRKIEFPIRKYSLKLKKQLNYNGLFELFAHLVDVVRFDFLILFLFSLVDSSEDISQEIFSVVTFCLVFLRRKWIFRWTKNYVCLLPSERNRFSHDSNGTTFTDLIKNRWEKSD